VAMAFIPDQRAPLAMGVFSVIGLIVLHRLFRHGRTG